MFSVLNRLYIDRLKLSVDIVSSWLFVCMLSSVLIVLIVLMVVVCVILMFFGMFVELDV